MEEKGTQKPVANEGRDQHHKPDGHPIEDLSRPVQPEAKPVEVTIGNATLNSKAPGDEGPVSDPGDLGSPVPEGAYRDELLDYQKTALDVGAKAGEAFDRTIYTLAAAALAFVASYLKDFRTEFFEVRYTIGLSIVLLVASMVFLAVGQYCNQEYLHAVSEQVRSQLAGLQPGPDRGSGLARVTRWMNPLALVAALAGIAMFMVSSYGVAFFRPPEEKSKQSRNEQRRPSSTISSVTNSSPAAHAGNH